MSKNFTFLISLIAAVFVFLFFFDQCGRERILSTTTQVQTIYNDSIYIDTVIQPVQHDSIVYKDRWHILNHLDTIIEIERVDTASIIKDYLAEVYGHHILKDDSLAFVGFDYLVSQNRLQNISNIQYQNRQPTQIITNTTIADNKDHIYVGTKLRLNRLVNDISIYGSYEHNRLQYQAGYNLFSESIELGVGFKLK